MIDNQTRNIAGMIETAYLAALNRNIVLVIYPYVKNQTIMDERLPLQEFNDLTETKELLLSLARRKNINVFDNLQIALNLIDWLFNKNVSFDQNSTSQFKFV
uniref:RNase NYN domain-containing protein n=2 Tax=Cuerna arida TaxID=1464854 RepID=A0A1B6EVU2_9HEMI